MTTERQIKALPPHISNAETPRTNAVYNQFKFHPLAVAANGMQFHSRQLERENLYLREVLEKMAEQVRDSDLCLDPTYKVEHRLNSEAISAYEQLKKDLAI